MSTDRQPVFRMGPTRPRDLLAVALVATIAAYVLVRLDYAHIPPLPRFGGVAAAVLGVAEGIFGYGIRGRIQARRRDDGTPAKPPVPPLTAARAVMTAKASALAGAALAGLWLGLLIYVLPDSGMITAARSDAVTGGIGLLCAAVMVVGSLYLEFCCRAPEDPRHDRRAAH